MAHFGRRASQIAAAVGDEVHVRLVRAVRGDQASQASWASSSDASAGMRPTRFETRSTWRVDRHEGRPVAEQEHDRGGLRADPRDARSASRGPRGPAGRRGSRAGGRRAPRGSSEGRPGCAAPSARRGRRSGCVSTSSGRGADSTASQSGGRPGSIPRRPSRRGRAPRRRGRRSGGPRPGRRRTGTAPESLEGALGVQVRRVLGEDREDELAGGVEPELPGGPTVEDDEAVEDVLDEARARAREAASPGDRGVGVGALARSRLRRPAALGALGSTTDAAPAGRARPPRRRPCRSIRPGPAAHGSRSASTVPASRAARRARRRVPPARRVRPSPPRRSSARSPAATATAPTVASAAAPAGSTAPPIATQGSPPRGPAAPPPARSCRRRSARRSGPRR